MAPHDLTERATPEEFAEQIVRALNVYPDPVNVMAVIPWVRKIRQDALRECRDEINKLMGKDSGNWNRAIVYAADALARLASEGG